MPEHSEAREATIAFHLSDVEARRRRRLRALAAFWVLTVALGALGAAVVSPWHSPWLGAGIGALLGAVIGTVVTVVMTVWPLLRALWQWLMELVLLAGVATLATVLAAWGGSWWWSTSLLALAGLGAAFRPVRRWVVAFAWCAIVRHRLRVCFAAFIRARNRIDPGLAPLILVARPTPAGERVWVWLRTGLDVDELERSTGKIAVACWASDVQVAASRRFAALVRLDITRRDPLRLVVGSPLAQVPSTSEQLAISGRTTGVLALELTQVPEQEGRR